MASRSEPAKRLIVVVNLPEMIAPAQSALNKFMRPSRFEIQLPRSTSAEESQDFEQRLRLARKRPDALNLCKNKALEEWALGSIERSSTAHVVIGVQESQTIPYNSDAESYCGARLHMLLAEPVGTKLSDATVQQYIHNDMVFARPFKGVTLPKAVKDEMYSVLFTHMIGWWVNRSHSSRGILWQLHLI